MDKRKKDSLAFKTCFGNKIEGQGFADRRKRKVAYEYLKIVKKEKRKALKTEAKETRNHNLSFFHTNRSFNKDKQIHAFSAAENFAKRQKEEKEKKRQEALRVKREKDTAMASYKDRKRTQHLRLCKRNSKGQPVMRFQMEALLEKIKSSCLSETWPSTAEDKGSHQEDTQEENWLMFKGSTET